MPYSVAAVWEAGGSFSRKSSDSFPPLFVVAEGSSNSVLIFSMVSPLRWANSLPHYRVFVFLPFFFVLFGFGFGLGKSPQIAGAISLLDHVRQFVREQSSSRGSARRIPAVGEHDVLADGIGVRAYGVRGCRKRFHCSGCARGRKS